jgi:hypothetical protein
MKYYLIDLEGNDTELTADEAKALLDSLLYEVWHTQPGITFIQLIES